MRALLGTALHFCGVVVLTNSHHTTESTNLRVEIRLDRDPLDLYQVLNIPALKIHRCGRTMRAGGPPWDDLARSLVL